MAITPEQLQQLEAAKQQFYNQGMAFPQYNELRNFTSLTPNFDDWNSRLAAAVDYGGRLNEQKKQFDAAYNTQRNKLNDIRTQFSNAGMPFAQYSDLHNQLADAQRNWNNQYNEALYNKNWYDAYSPPKPVAPATGPGMMGMPGMMGSTGTAATPDQLLDARLTQSADQQYLTNMQHSPDFRNQQMVSMVQSMPAQMQQQLKAMPPQVRQPVLNRLMQSQLARRQNAVNARRPRLPDAGLAQLRSPSMPAPGMPRPRINQQQIQNAAQQAQIDPAQISSLMTALFGG